MTLARFEKVAADLKTIAPKAKDFLYFSAVMMHAAEASLLGDDNELKKDASGNDLTANWDKSNDTWKWVCSDTNVKPYKNSNNDIFPEEELLKAHKDWVGKPLCLDHKSSSVDMIRGVIVDTYYDYPRKRVVALCALDKATYPDLAYKVQSRVSTSVSMGTAVGQAICSDCATVARTEADFCDCMRNKSCYGEINIDLKPIELSIVVNGADPKAQIRHIVASAANSIAKYVSDKEKQISKLSDHKMVDHDTISTIKKDLESAVQRLGELEKTAKDVEEIEEAEESDPGIHAENTNINVKLASIAKDLNRLQQNVDTLLEKSEDTNMTSKKAYHLGGGGVNDPSTLPYPKEDYQSIRDKQDKQMVGESPFPNVGPVDGLYPGDKETKTRILRAEEAQRSLRRQAVVEKAKDAAKRAYHLGGGGVNDPSTLPYPKEDYQSIRDKQDKQMVGESPFPDTGPVDGLYPGDKETKEKLLRAKLTAKFIKSAHPDGTDNLANSRWQVYANKKLILTATVDDLTGNADMLYDSVANKEFGRKILNTLRANDFATAKSMLLKNAQMPPAPGGDAAPAPDMGGGMEEPEDMDAGGGGDPRDELPSLLDKAENTLADIRSAVDALLEEPGEELEGLSDVAEGMPPAAAARFNKKLYLQKKVGNAIAVGMQKAARSLSSNIEELRMSQHILANKHKVDRDNYEYALGLTASACEDTKETLAGCHTLMESFVRYANGTKAILKQAGGVDTGDTSKAKKRKLPGKHKPKAPAQRPKHSPGGGSKKRPKKETYVFEEDSRGADDGGFDELEDDDGFMFMDGIDTTPSPEAMDRKPKMREHKPAPPPYTVPEAEEAGYKQEPKETWEFVEEMDDDDGFIFMDGIDTTPSDEALERKPKMREHKPEAPPQEPVHDPHPGAGYQQEGEDFEFEMSDDTAYAAEVQFPSGAKVTGVTGDDLAQMMGAASDEDASIVVEASADGGLDLTTKAGRAAYREKLAQKGLKFSPMLGEAHPGGGETTQLDTKPTGDLAKVETLEETNKAMMDLATAPPRVRQAAEELQQLIVNGTISDTSDEYFASLIANGLDPAAVKYWKQYYGQGDSDASQFATELVKEHQAKKAAEDKKAFEVKIARAYELAYDMADRGMISKERAAVSEQAKEIMAFDDNGFSSLKRFVDRQAVTKQASIPQVGMLGANSVTVPAPPAAAAGQNELAAALAEAFSTNYKPRMF
jgi:hypothetical protein